MALNQGAALSVQTAKGLLKAKEDIFDGLYKFVVNAVGEFFVLFQQMLFYKSKAKDLEDNKKNYYQDAKDRFVGNIRDPELISQQENRYDRALLSELQRENTE